MLHAGFYPNPNPNGNCVKLLSSHEIDINTNTISLTLTLILNLFRYFPGLLQIGVRFKLLLEPSRIMQFSLE